MSLTYIQCQNLWECGNTKREKTPLSFSEGTHGVILGDGKDWCALFLFAPITFAEHPGEDEINPDYGEAQFHHSTWSLAKKHDEVGKNALSWSACFLQSASKWGKISLWGHGRRESREGAHFTAGSLTHFECVLAKGTAVCFQHRINNYSLGLLYVDVCAVFHVGENSFCIKNISVHVY